jgi:Na+/H+ antiporter NhaD/arsenite permease-like protein
MKLSTIFSVFRKGFFKRNSLQIETRYIHIIFKTFLKALLPPRLATRLMTVLLTTHFFPTTPESSLHSNETRKFLAQEQSEMTRPKSNLQFTAMSQLITLDFCFSSGRIAALTFSEVSPPLYAFY